MDINPLGENAGQGHPSPDHNSTKTFNQVSPVTRKVKTGLTDYSPKDKPWNDHRTNADIIAGYYADDEQFEKRGARMAECSETLNFERVVDVSTGEMTLKLRDTRFCRVPGCPVCQWRRSKMWQARFYQSLPKIVEGYPKSRWLFLTLTVPNPEVTDLGETLTEMNKAWQRLIKRKEFRPVQGWIRTTEITQEKEIRNRAHPHFHVLLMVPPSWFSHNYVKRNTWLKLWRDCMRDQSITQVDIRTVKAKKGAKETLTLEDLLGGAVAETFKYSVKEDDLTTDKKFFLEMMRQLHKKRLIASGGALKSILKPDKETNDDLVGADGDEVEPTAGKLLFDWKSQKRGYHKRKKQKIWE